MRKKKQRGGQRNNSGRKAIEDKKKGITIYVRESHINFLGGRDAVREKALNAITGGKNI